MLRVVRNYAEVKDIENKFLKTRMLLLKIQQKCKHFLHTKETRITELNSIWDDYKNKLINDFIKGSKEIKKEIEKIAVIRPDTRDMMLDQYYSKKFNEFALKFIRWRFRIYQSWSAEEYENIFKY